MEENWKLVKDHEDYEVSNLGRIRRKGVPDLRGNKRKEKILKLSPATNSNNNIYYKVFLSGKNGRKNFLIHRLVCSAFNFQPEGKNFVNHIDGKPENNNAVNLEWVTREENQQHAILTGLHPIGCKSSNAKLSKEQVLFIRDNHKRRSETLSINAIKNKYKISAITYNRLVNYKTYKTEIV
jgi:hypothetical protein